MKNACYDTSLTDAQWSLVEPLMPAAARLGRPRTPLRVVFDSILYVAKSGCPWRLLPANFPPWKTVYHHFHRWCLDGTMDLLNQALRAVARNIADKRSRPTAAIIDSQTVRSDPHGGEVAYDAAKKTKGRKRFLCVDTLGLVLDVVLLPANTPEREGAKVLLEPVLKQHAWLRKIWADGGFSGPEFAHWVKERRPKAVVEVVRRCDQTSGFHVLPRRWVIERTFGWLCQHRRLVRDYEKTTRSARAWILVAMTRIMLRRLA
jgi:putative transposase